MWNSMKPLFLHLDDETLSWNPSWNPFMKPFHETSTMMLLVSILRSRRGIIEDEEKDLARGWNEFTKLFGLGSPKIVLAGKP